MNEQHRVALANHCRLSIETMHPRFARITPSGMSVALTVNSGYE